MSSLEQALANIDKKFGKDAIAGEPQEVEFITSGSIALDAAMGGGYPLGRIVELSGWESSGKSTLALHAAAEVQKEGRKVLYIDSEHALDPFYAANLGVDIDFEKKDKSFFLSQPNSAEEAFEIAKEFLKVSEIGLVIFDSVAAMKTKAEIQGEAGDAHMGTLARLMSAESPKINMLTKKHGKCCTLFINQFREKIGVMFGSNITQPGGNALKFYASVRMEVNKAGMNKEGDDVTSINSKVKIKKNKVAPPFKEAIVQINFGTGIDKVAEVLNIGVDLGIVDKKGSWFSYGKTRLGQGFAAVKSLLEDNLELVEEIKGKIYGK